MKKLAFLSFIILASCGGQKEAGIVESDPFKEKINNYSKAKTNNPDRYEPGTISDKKILTDNDSLLIKECYDTKYGSHEIDFNKPTPLKQTPFSSIHEKFYTVLNSFKAQNNQGALVKYDLLLYLDSADNIIFSQQL